MKITDVKATILQYRYENAIADAQNYFDVRSAVIVQVYTDEGLIGIGESACFGGPPQSTKDLIENELKGIVLGEDATNIEHIWQKMFCQTRQHGRGGIIYAAMSGIDIALWDLLGKKAGLPVYKLLGGYADKLVPYASAGFYTRNKGTVEIADEVESYFKLGFKYAKIKAGRNPEVLLTPLHNMKYANECCYSLDEDLERIAACCEVASRYDGKILVDVNNTWNTYTAIQMGRKLQDMGVYWLEEPLHLDNIDGYSELAAALDMPIAGCESEIGLYRFREYIQRRAVDIVQPDVVWSGGITECMKIANFAFAYNLPVNPHIFSSGVCLAANMHFLAAIGNAGILEMDRNIYPLRDELLTEKIDIAADGYVHLPAKPGLGIELNQNIFEKYAI